MHYHDALLGSIIESPRNDLSDIGDIPWRSIVPQGQIRDREAAGTVEIPADGNHAYYRRDGRHYVPKVRAEELIIPHACGQQH